MSKRNGIGAGTSGGQDSESQEDKSRGVGIKC